MPPQLRPRKRVPPTIKTKKRVSEPPAKKLVLCERVAFVPPRDSVMDRVLHASEGTRFLASLGLLTGLLQQWDDVSDSLSVYGGAKVLLEQFVASRELFARKVDENGGDIAQIWRRELRLHRDNTRARIHDGKPILRVDDHENMASVVADVCFLRFVYEDVSVYPSSVDLSAATQHARIVEEIIKTKVFGGEAIHVVQLLQLLTMF
ncbi:unnamed protein product [Ectocarpus sp. 6 AP-2014]